MDALDQATQSLYGPNQPQKPQGLAAQFPYSYEPGSQYGAAPSGLAPDTSMYAPSGQQGPPQAQAPAMPQAQFGGPEDDGGAANAANAHQIGQGVLAASQEATKKKGIGGMGGMGGGMGG